MTNTLDAREVLRCLNDMGYRNITSSQLKEFIIDLRKLIKYEEQFCCSNKDTYCGQNESKVKFDKNFGRRESHKSSSAPVAKKRIPAGNLEEKHIEIKHKDIVGQKSRTNKKAFYGKDRDINHLYNNSEDKENLQENVLDKNNPENKPTKKEKVSARNNRPKSARGIRENDPVELYQYYKREWERFKKNLPGENSHSELRWNIKKKLLNIKEKSDFVKDKL